MMATTQAPDTREVTALLQQRIADLEADNARLWARNQSLVDQRDVANRRMAAGGGR